MPLSRSSQKRLIRYVFAALLLMFFSQGALAAWCSSGGGQTYTLTMPVSVSVPRNAPAGTQLSGWVEAGNSTSWYVSCGAASSYSGTGFRPVGLSQTAASYTESGVTYPLFATGVAGVGMAISARVYTGAACPGSIWSNWGPVSGTGSSIRFPGSASPVPGWSYAGCTGFLPGGNLGGDLQVKLVTTGSVSPGVTASGVQIEAASVYSGAANTTNPFISFFVTPTTVTVLACTTPDVVVPLGSHSSSEMASVGSFTTAVSFNVSLNSCPAGMNSVQYRIDPVTTVVNSAQSVVALNSGSTAAGVGVQLLNSAGTAAFPLSSYQIFSGYSKTTGGSYTIPLKARYYRTGTITPGTANTSMTFTMSYQ